MQPITRYYIQQTAGGTMRVRVIKCTKANWYKIGEEFEVRDTKKYGEIGIQVWNSNGLDKHPDIIMHGDYEYIGRYIN